VKRKSKLTAYLLSIFFGWLGFDRFYLGNLLAGIVKLLTFGLFGLWWIYDVMWISAGEVYAKEYRLAADMLEGLPALLTPAIFIAFGFIITGVSVLR